MARQFGGLMGIVLVIALGVVACMQLCAHGASPAPFWPKLCERQLALASQTGQNGCVIICVATDLAPSFERTIEHALQWAKAHDATVVLLHVVHDPELAPALASDAPGDLVKAKAVLQQVADQASVPCRVDVRAADNVANEIVKASENAAYVFMGSQGKSAFERLRLGSIATAVMRQSQVPVVCCPHVANAE